MNINHLIKRLKDELGLSRYFASSYTDHDIYNIITKHALDEFGRYFKKEVELDNVVLSTRIGSDIYLIPDWIIQKLEICNLRIEDIKTIRFTRTQVDRSALGMIAGIRGDSMSLENAYTANYEMRRRGGADIFYNYLNSCYFEKPNRIRFVWNNTLADHVPTCTLSILVSMSNNLIGVDVGREHTFYELCKLSLMTVIYQNEAKYIESISSGLGLINLKVEDWQNAGNEKKELLAKMYNDSILAQNAIKVI